MLCWIFSKSHKGRGFYGVYNCLHSSTQSLFTIVKFTLFSFVNMRNEVLKNLFREEFYSKIKFKKVTGRYVINPDLDLILDELSSKFKTDAIGKSVKNREIKMTTFGTGEIKILAWSQMHGNEGTTTKAVFDLLNAFNLNIDDTVLSDIYKSCTLYIIPILNPDGAAAYTRINANKVDLNRDMQALSQPESKILIQQYHKIKPDYCLNLHDQRTIFSAGSKPEPATLSFLTPSKDASRSIDEYRMESMAVIAGIAQDLSNELKNRIGRYDDAFNINCAGDTFQNLSTPTILFEAGHFPGDYERETTRKFVFKALISCIYQIAEKTGTKNYKEYIQIPENEKLFNDVIIRNALVEGKKMDVAIQFIEKLVEGKVEFIPKVAEMRPKITKFAHKEIDAEGQEIQLPNKSELDENVIVDKIIINNRELRVKYE